MIFSKLLLAQQLGWSIVICMSTKKYYLDLIKNNKNNIQWILDNIYGAIKRMESYHDNRKEDRRWHFECSYGI